MKKVVAVLAVAMAATMASSNVMACSFYTASGTVKCEMKDMRTEIENICKSLSDFTNYNGLVPVSRKAVVDSLKVFNSHVVAAQKLATSNSAKAQSAEEKAGINDSFHAMVGGESSHAQEIIDSLSMSAIETLNAQEVAKAGEAIDEMLALANAGHAAFAQGIQVTIPVKCISK